jgi:acetylornithine/succinyldiaminopimelate/putrescine aminotransferase
VFKGDTLVIQLDLENENQLMENIIENYGSRYISQYEKLVCNQIWQRHGSIDNYIDWLGGWQIKKNGKLNRSVLSKKRKELQRLQHQRAFIFKNDDGGKLYRELYKALCA